MMESISTQNKFWIINARLLQSKGLFAIAIESGKIARILPMKNNRWDNVLDVGGDWLSLAGIDLQINGGLGLAFPDLKREDLPILERIGRYLWEWGVDEFCPTLVTTSVEKIQQSLAVIARSSLLKKQTGMAHILGVHLEGPFLNFAKRGAHPEEYLLPLNLNNVKQVLGEFAPLVKIITLAPELDETGAIIPYLRSLGITVSLGHSLATAEQARDAFDRGASMVTHAFNAMPGLHHRQPGLLGEAMVRSGVYCGLIADGQHVCPTMIQVLLRGSSPLTPLRKGGISNLRKEGISNLRKGGISNLRKEEISNLRKEEISESEVFLVSDALAPIGLPDGVYPWDRRTIEVRQGTARLPDGTLSGTTLPLLVGVENLARWDLCEIETAIALATENPRKAIARPGFAIGETASFLRWHWQEKEQKLTWQRVELEDRS